MEYISPEQALNVLARLAPAFQAAGSSPGASPLPPSLSLKLKAPLDLARVRSLVARAAKEPGVAQVLFDWDWVDRLRVYSRFVGLLGWVLFGALGLAAVFTVAAICRIIALNRREEIVILHFVGATGSSISRMWLSQGIFSRWNRLWALLRPLACCRVFWWARKEGHWVKKTENAPKPISSIA